MEFLRIVTYCPSTDPSIKRCTCVNNRCIRSRISEYHLDLWTGGIQCRCDAHRKQVEVKQLYNPVPQRVWVSWSSRQAEFSSSSSRSWGQDTVVRASARQRTWALRTPVKQLSRMRKKCGYNTEELGVNMWQSDQFRTHLTHITNINFFATLSRIKCERYIF